MLCGKVFVRAISQSENYLCFETTTSIYPVSSHTVSIHPVGIHKFNFSKSDDVENYVRKYLELK